MEELVGELERCLAENGSDEGATMVVRPGRRPKAQRPKRHVPVVPILLIVLAVAALAGGAYLLAGGAPDVPVVADEESPAGPVRLTGAGAFDPEGGDGEHDAAAVEATDGNAETAWTTEDYQDFTKSGVGLVLRAASEVALSRLTIRSVQPGFTATIQAGPDDSGPFVDVSDRQEVTGETTTFEVDTGGERYRYYVIWLALPREGGQAYINEVTARS